MSSRKYPYVSERLRIYPKKKNLCGICGQLAIRRITIQVNWFRGDDEIVYVCDEHAWATTEKLITGASA